MRKWLRSIDWIDITTSALILVCAMNVGSWLFPAKESQNCVTKKCASNKPADDKPWWSYAGTYEAFFTGLIAVYAVQQYVESRKSSERQLRAYISFTKTRIRNVGLGETPEFFARIYNAGQTPAYRFTATFNPGLYPIGVVDALNVVGPAPQIMSRVALGPKMKVVNTARLSSALSIQDLQDINDGVKGIVVFGRIDFIDAFDQPRHKFVRLMYTNRMMASCSERLEVCAIGNDEN